MQHEVKTNIQNSKKKRDVPYWNKMRLKITLTLFSVDLFSSVFDFNLIPVVTVYIVFECVGHSALQRTPLHVPVKLH